MNKGMLIPSKWTTGRWQINNSNVELSCGYPISIYVNSEWIKGNVEHNGRCYYFLADGLKLDLSEELYVRDDYKK